MNNKKVTAALSKTAVFSLIACALSMPAFAKDGDFHKAGVNKGDFRNIYLNDKETLFDVLTNTSAYQYEVGTKFYDAEKVNEVFVKNPGATMATIYAEIAKTVTPIENNLTVSSVTAINKTTIKVTFSGAVDAVTVSNFSVKVGSTVKAIDTVSLSNDKKVVTLSVQGLSYADALTVGVTGVKSGTTTIADYTTTTNVPALGDLYKLEVTCDDADAKILADGATKTMLTAKLVDKATNAVVNLDGVVDFTTTRGGLAQGQVTLVDGSASVQLTSSASDSNVLAYVTAVISQAPGASEYEGLTGALQVTFSPEITGGEGTTFVSVQKAESNQGDRFFVTYSGNVKATDYKAALVKAANAADWNTLVAAGTSAGMTVDAQAIKVSDIIQKSSNVLEFILDTDTDTSVKPTTSQITTGWAAGATKNYLRDNATHSIAIASNVGDYVLATGSPISFIMTDALIPFIYGVTPEDQLKFTVRFSESMAEDNVEGGLGAVNDKFLLDGQKVILNVAPTSLEVSQAKASNSVIVNQLSVGNYAKTTAVDTRNIVTFKLDPSFKMASGAHQIQIANVADWAGLVDVNNVVSTQTFDFTVIPDDSKPVPTITKQSAEQWLVTFNEDVTVKVAGKTIADSVKIFKADEAVTPLVYGTDYVVTAIDENGNRLAAPGVVTTATKYWLVEMTKDWTTYYDTAATTVNYFTSTKNPYKVTVDNFEDALKNVMAKADLAVTLSYDGDSPSASSAIDVHTIATKTANGVTVTGAGQAVFVTMSEPVQLRDAANTALKMSTPLTQSQQQLAGAGVPVPTFEFVKGDKTVEGTIANGSIEEADRDFVVTPASTLGEGTWTLYIRSISDDIGNTSATTSTTVTVLPGENVVTNTKVAWAAFDNARTVTTGKDYLYIKFTKVMDAAGVTGVSRTTNYVFNGVALPLGSQVYKGIAGVTTEWDGVTIEMPGDFFIPGINADGNTDATSVLNVANNFKSADGELLSGPYEVQLIDQNGMSQHTAAGDMLFEAKYVNASSSALIGGAAVTRATASDEDADGKIDRIVATLDGANTKAILVTDSILVNGKTFTVSGAAAIGATTTVIYNAGVDTNEVTGTNTDTLTVTNSDGAKLITNRVVDAAIPVINTAVLNAAKDKLVVTFSEAVTANSTYAATGFATTTDANYAKVGNNSVVAASGHVESAPNTVTFTVTGGAAILANATIAGATNPNFVYDYAGNAVPTTPKVITGGVIGVTANPLAITQGNPGSVAVASTGTVTYGVPVIGDTVVVDGTTFTNAAVGNGTTDYSTAAELTALIEGLANVNAVNVAGTITITATPAGAAGNLIALAQTGTGTGTISGATLTGGTDLVVAATEKADLTVATGAAGAGNIIVTVAGTPYTVAVLATDSTPTLVATKIAAQLVVPGYNVTSLGAVVTFTSTTANTNVADITVSIAAN